MLIVTVSSLLAAPACASAASIADVAARLASDSRRLGEARADLVDTRSDLRATRREHRSLRIEIEARVVAIYKSGGGIDPIAHVASGGSMAEVGTSLDTLDIVARHEQRALDRWTSLGRRATKLARTQKQLIREVATDTKRVAKSRELLSAAVRRAAEARRAAAKMARTQDSPLLPKVGHPEINAVAAAEDTPEPQQPVGFVQSGTASMYADSFTGQTTSNGEKYDPNAFTAAHPSLPFGTWVNVSGPGGTIAVRINDRGPFIGGRIIDLSRAAANAISLPGIGTVALSVSA